MSSAASAEQGSRQEIRTHIPAALAQAFYTVPQVARLLGYTKKQLYNLLESGFIASVRIHPSVKRSRFRIPKTEVYRLLAHRIVANTLKPRCN